MSLFIYIVVPLFVVVLIVVAYVMDKEDMEY
jgi:hypothetical protein